MAGFYETWFQSPKLGPGWMHDPVGQAYWGSVGKVLDLQVARLKSGVRSRFPEDAAALGMTDALEEIGRDRMLPRGGATPGANDEALATWAARLKDAWTAWEKAGSAKGLLEELAVQGFPTGELGTVLVNHVGRGYYLDGNGDLVIFTAFDELGNRVNKLGVVPTPSLKGFTLDARDQFSAHFAILFLQDVPTLTNDAGNVAKAILNQTVRRWRQSGAHYAGAAVVPQENDAEIFGWPQGKLFGDAGRVFGAAGSRVIDPE